MTKQLSALIALSLSSACAAGSEAEPQAPTQSVVADYKPCPPTMAISNCEMAVLEGDPRSEGAFTMRIRSQGSWVIPPHAHPRAARITVLKGDMHYGLGATVDKSQSETFSAGDHYVSAPGTVHYTWADEALEIQLTGMGPWESHPHK